jgi:hypothetical protein
MSEANTAVAPAQGVSEKWLQQFTGEAVVPSNEPVKGVGAYITYVWRKTTNEDLKDAVKARTGGQLDLFVLQRAGFVDPLKPFRFHLFDDNRTIVTQNDTAGKIIDAEANREAVGEAWDRTWAEHFFGIVGVVQGKSIVPAVVSARRGMAKAFSNAVVALKDSKNPEKWASKGEPFRISGQLRFPAGRFVVTSSARAEKTPDGNDMLKGMCSIQAATIEDMERFQKHLFDAQFQADFDACQRSYAYKLNLLLGNKAVEAGEDGQG